MATSSAARRRPPEPPQAGPADDLLGPVVDRERRRGRGAVSNASGRYEPRVHVPVDDGWQSLEELPPFKTTVGDRHGAQDHHPQRLARHLVRPLDQSLSRLRARLRLLLRPADPRLSRPLARARFRIQAVHEAGRARTARARAVGARLCAAHHRDRHQHRSLPADREAVRGDAAHPPGPGEGRPSGRHRHQVGAGPARSRHAHAHGRAQPGQGGAVGDDARSQARAHHGAAGGDAGAPARHPAPARRRRRSRPASWSRR